MSRIFVSKGSERAPIMVFSQPMNFLYVFSHCSSLSFLSASAISGSLGRFFSISALSGEDARRDL
jgi:hypothetical protein